LACLAAAGAPAAAAKVDDEGKLEIYGDFRLRAEADWDSRRADGTERDDRNRIRIRARVGLDWKPLEGLSFGLRLRTGSDDNQQSGHITIIDLDDNDTGDAHVNLDKWFVKGTRGKLWGWAGRNSLPFWKQNDMIWDDDVTPSGVAGGLGQSVGERGKLTFHLGYFSLPVGMQEFAGNLGLGQIVYENDGDRFDFTVAGGLLRIEANPSDMDAATLRFGNGLRDYSIVVVDAQVKLGVGGRPLTLGVDYLSNQEDYGPSDAFGFANRDETEGHVVSVQWGGTGEKGDWLVGYWYADIGTLAVNASYAQDDWIRWGSGTQTDSSDLQGHELRFAYGLGRVGNLVARLYLVESAGGFVLDGAGNPVSSSEQDGKRFRLDYNVKF
jgi:hypothetical protein